MDHDEPRTWELIPQDLVLLGRQEAQFALALTDDELAKMDKLGLGVYQRPDSDHITWVGLTSQRVHPHDRWLFGHIAGTAHAEPLWLAIYSAWQRPRKAASPLAREVSNLALERNLNLFTHMERSVNQRRVVDGTPPIPAWQLIAHMQLVEWGREMYDIELMLAELPANIDFHVAHMLLHHDRSDWEGLGAEDLPLDVLARMYGVQQHLLQQQVGV